MLSYLIEDDALKAGRLLAFLGDRYPSLSVEVFGSFQSGLRAIGARVPDVVLLDMSLPTYDRQENSREGRRRPLGGYDLLRKLKLKNLRPKVIVVTQLESFGDGSDEVSYSEVVERCSQEFPGLFVGGVHFRQSDSGWQFALSSLLDCILNEAT